MNRPYFSDVLNSVVQLLAELEVPLVAGEPARGTYLFEGGLELDSFTVVELLARIEEHFGMRFHDTDFSADRFTLGALAEVVESRIAGAA